MKQFYMLVTYILKKHSIDFDENFRDRSSGNSNQESLEVVWTTFWNIPSAIKSELSCTKTDVHQYYR